MKVFTIKRCLHCLLLMGVLTSAHAQVFNFKPVKLSAEQRTSLKRFLADSSSVTTYDWDSLTAQYNSVGRERRQLSVTLSTLPALTPAGVCRSEQHHFEPAIKPSTSKARWLAIDALTSYQAWTPSHGECAATTPPIELGKSVSDAEFLFIERETHALRSRAAQVVGGSDCARVRFCEVRLRRIDRASDETPSGKSRTITKLTFSPQKPGPACLYGMEISFVGPLNELVPLGASCPMQ